MDGFYGEFNVNLDEKGRIALPSKIRPRNEDGSSLKLFIGPALETGCLTVYTPQAWQALKAQLKANSYGFKSVRALSRYYFSMSREVTPDKQGRFIIPEKLILFAELKQQALIIGVDDLIEIWNPRTYAAYMAEQRKTIIEQSEKLSGNGLKNGSSGGAGSDGRAE